MNKIFEPVELIEPLNLKSDIFSDEVVVIKCKDPGYICYVGKDITPWYNFF